MATEESSIGHVPPVRQGEDRRGELPPVHTKGEEAKASGSDGVKLTDECRWDDAKLRHAYRPSNRRIALCGYDGPTTWKNEWPIPKNVCPICLAILPEFVDLKNRKWLNP